MIDIDCPREKAQSYITEDILQSRRKALVTWNINSLSLLGRLVYQYMLSFIHLSAGSSGSGNYPVNTGHDGRIPVECFPVQF